MSELAIIIRHDSRDDVSEEVREKVNEDTRGVAGHVLVLGVIGPLTRRTTPALRDYLRQTISNHQQDPGPHLLLDVSCCTDIDVDGLLALAVAQNAARSHGGDPAPDRRPTADRLAAHPAQLRPPPRRRRGTRPRRPCMRRGPHTIPRMLITAEAQMGSDADSTMSSGVNRNFALISPSSRAV